MRKYLLFLSSLLFCFSSNSQTIVDTVSISAGYADQVWYSLENGEQGRTSQSNWDLAFDVSGFGTSIRINSANGLMLWTYLQADTSGWSSVDTSGIFNWKANYNSDSSWAIGAFDKGASSNDPFDVGWGIYNMSNHIITGDSLFVIKLADGSYKKLWIENLTSGAFNFRYADLDGSNEIDTSISKSAFAGKMFAYYSLQNDTAIDREVAIADWDITFTKYTAFLPIPYAVTGMLTNSNVEVAQVENVDVLSYNNYGGANFTSRINEIGYDWKSFSMGSGYSIEDSLLYFVKTDSNEIWKIVPLAFGGSANGNFIFSKEKITSVGLEEEQLEKLSLTIYPNPASVQNLHVLYDVKHFVDDVSLTLHNIRGKIIYSAVVGRTIGLHDLRMNIEELPAGMYFISMESEGQRIQRKLIVQ